MQLRHPPAVAAERRGLDRVVAYAALLGEAAAGRTFFHGHTYTGNPLACAAALANLDLMGKRHTVEGVRERGEVLAEELAPLAGHPHVGDIRQKGFMVGIELVENKSTRQPFDSSRRIGHLTCDRLRSHGIILRPLGDVIVLMPPLAMPISDIATIIESLRKELLQL